MASMTRTHPRGAAKFALLIQELGLAHFYPEPIITWVYKAYFNDCTLQFSPQRMPFSSYRECVALRWLAAVRMRVLHANIYLLYGT
jgi:hypothetical protein